jgi:hypothetical protein
VLRRWLPLLAVVALLAGAFLAAAYAEPQIDVAPLEPPSPSAEQPVAASGEPSASPPPDEAAEPNRIEINIPPWLNQLLTVLCLVGAAVIGLVLLWFVLRSNAQARGRPVAIDEGATPAPAARAEDLAAAVDAGLAELAGSDTDPRRAVIACWVRLEEAAAAAGTPRHASDAPADYVLRLLAAHRVSRPVLDRFAAVYRQARYSTGPVDEGMRTTAVSALGRLRAELTVAVVT